MMDVATRSDALAIVDQQGLPSRPSKSSRSAKSMLSKASTSKQTQKCLLLAKRSCTSYYLNPWNIASGNLDVCIETAVMEERVERPYDQYGILDDCYPGCAETLLEKTFMCPFRFNPFALDRFIGKPVYYFGMYLFDKCGFFKGSEPLLDPIDAGRLLRDIEENYHYKNPYHNQLHTVDVTQSFYVLMHLDGFKEKFSLSDTELMVALFAALCHDVDHPGNTSKYVCMFKHDFYLRDYNQKYHELRGKPNKPIEFTLENHHAEMANSMILSHKILQKAKCPKREQDILLNLMCDLINATDMERHKSLVEKFETHLIRVTSSRCTENFIQSIKTDALQLLIKCADISNPFREWNTAATWATLVCEEFYQQNDKEKLIKENFMTAEEIAELPPVTGAADRTKQMSAIQIGFISFVVEPLFKTFATLDGTVGSQRILEMIQRNLQRWKVSQKLHADNEVDSYLRGCVSSNNNELKAQFKERKSVKVIIRTA